MENIINEIRAERSRQITKEGWTLEHDDCHINGEMTLAASCYAQCAASDRIFDAWKGFLKHNHAPTSWPWDVSWWKPKDRRSSLVKAAALIVAEIERLDRTKGA